MLFHEVKDSVDRSEKPVRVWDHLIGANTEEARNRRLNEWDSAAQLQQYRAAFVQELKALSESGTPFTEEDILEKLNMTQNMFSLEEDQLQRYIQQRQSEVNPTLATIESIRNILATNDFTDQDKADFDQAIRDNEESIQAPLNEIKIAERLKRATQTLLNRSLREAAELIVTLPEDRRLKPAILDEETRSSIESFGLDPDTTTIDTVELTEADRFPRTSPSKTPYVPLSEIRLAVEDFLSSEVTAPKVAAAEKTAAQAIEKAMAPTEAKPTEPTSEKPALAPASQPAPVLSTLNKIERDLEIEAAHDLAKNFKTYKDNPDLEALILLHFKQPVTRTARIINERLGQGLKDEQTLELIEHRRALMAFAKQFDELKTARDLAENFENHKNNPDLNKLAEQHFKQPIARATQAVKLRLEQGLKDEQTLELIEHKHALIAYAKKFDNHHTAENNLRQVKEAFGLKGDQYVLAAQDDYAPPLEDESLDDSEHDRFAPEELKDRAKTLWDFAHTDEVSTLKAYLFSSMVDDLNEARDVANVRREKGEDVSHIEKFILHAQISAKIAKDRIKEWDIANPETEPQPQQSNGLLGRIGKSVSSLTSAFTHAVKSVREFVTPKRLAFGVLGAGAIAAAIWGTTPNTPDVKTDFTAATTPTVTAPTASTAQKITPVAITLPAAQSTPAVSDAPKQVMHGDFTLAEVKSMFGEPLETPEAAKPAHKKAPSARSQFAQASVAAEPTGISNVDRTKACNFVYPNGGEGLQSCLNIALN